MTTDQFIYEALGALAEGGPAALTVAAVLTLIGLGLALAFVIFVFRFIAGVWRDVDRDFDEAHNRAKRWNR